ncbi:MAG: peroxiredoxin [Parachlamydiaceae bacterium]
MGVLVGRRAPEIKTKAVHKNKIINDFNLLQFHGMNIILFFYPLDFTFVCPTEMHAFQDHLADFEKRNTQVIACSVDSVYTHLAWLNTPRSKGGIAGVTYPILSDINKTICRDFDVLVPNEGIAYRGLFLIDSNGLVRHQIVNDLPIGRSIDEALRTIDALNYHETHGEVCPANWALGKKSLKPSQEGLEEYFVVSAN